MWTQAIFFRQKVEDMCLVLVHCNINDYTMVNLPFKEYWSFETESQNIP